MKKILIILILLLMISNTSFATSAITYEYNFDDTKIVQSIKDLNNDFNKSYIELKSYLDITNKYIMLVFLIISIVSGFLIGYLLARKKV